VIDEVSGSTGKTGTADTIMGIFKKRNFSDTQLKIIGRDVPDKDVTIEWQDDTCTWYLRGDTQEIIDDRTDAKAIRAVKELADEATHARISDFCEWKKPMTTKRLDKLIAEGKLGKNGKGKGSIYIIINDPWVVK